MPVTQAFHGTLTDHPILLDDLVCNGAENDLLTCPCDNDGENGPCVVGDTDCSHSEDAGVRCEGK